MLLFLCTALPAAADSAITSWYGPGFEHRRMACGDRFHARDETIVASKTLACGTRVRFTNTATGATAIGIVQDRGPYVRGRQFDVSAGLADLLGFRHAGVTALEVEYPDEPERQDSAAVVGPPIS